MTVAPSPGAVAPSGLEIERKFLVATMPEPLTDPGVRIAQGYLAVDPDGAEVRLRRAGEDTLLTVKQGRGLARTEVEFPIDRPEFERLWGGTRGRRIEKRRHRIPLEDGLVAELDRYDGDLTGLVVAEVEFPSVAAAQAFRAPEWLRPEVTGDPRYSNARLAVDGIPDRRPAGDHALLDGEPVTRGLRLVVLAEIDEAADALQGRDAIEPDRAVHVSRKAFKRGKALVRLAQDGLGPAVTERDRDAFREAGRLLAGSRDAAVVLETLDGLIERFPDELTDDVTAALRGALTDDLARESGSGEDSLAGVLALLQTLRGDVAEWELGEDPADVLAGGLLRIHRRGRKAYDEVAHLEGEGVTDALHSLRKRAKELWYAAELVEVAAPKRLRTLGASAHALSDLIGDDHDLAVLDDRTAAWGALGDDAARSAAVIQASIRKRRAKLQRKSHKLAAELYGRDLGGIAERIRELGPS